MGHNLAQLRVQRGWSKSQAATAFNLSLGGYAKIESSERPITLDAIERAAKLYGVTVMEVISSPAQVPIVAHAVVSDGRPRLVYDGIPSEVAELSPGRVANLAAVRLIGGSLDTILREGTLFFFRQQRDPIIPDVIGELVVAGLDTDEVYLQRIFNGSAPGLHHLETPNGNLYRDQRVLWATPVSAIMPAWRAQQVIRPQDPPEPAID